MFFKKNKNPHNIKQKECMLESSFLKAFPTWAGQTTFSRIIFANCFGAKGGASLLPGVSWGCEIFHRVVLIKLKKRERSEETKENTALWRMRPYKTTKGGTAVFCLSVHKG